MKKTYEELLFDANVSYCEIINAQNIPTYLYKYQSFYSQDMVENKYWSDNLKGAFHLSIGKEFEDQNDCKPYINKASVIDSLEKFFCSLNLTQTEIQALLTVLDSDLNNKYFEDIISNYQSEIRIGCFTTSPDNNYLWEKYANNKTGYCLEYKTSKSPLFKHTTLPVLYSKRPYDSSLTLVHIIIFEYLRQQDNKTFKKKIESYCARIAKLAYIPLFIKEYTKWSLEEEYRMFLLKHRNTQIGLLIADNFLNENANIDLSDAITTIYLGEKFYMNLNHELLKEKIDSIASELNIKVVQKR